jgi:hypothetical protein
MTVHCGWCRCEMNHVRVRKAVVITDDQVTHGLCGSCDELLQLGATPPLCSVCKQNWRMQTSDMCGDCFRRMEGDANGKQTTH